MGRCGPVLVVSGLLVFGISSSVFAQQPSAPTPPSPDNALVEQLTPDQDRELRAWLSQMESWQRDEKKWHNRPRRDGWGRIVARRSPPDAPLWLAAQCAGAAATSVADLHERLTNACRLLEDPHAAIGSPRQQATAARADAEKPQRHSMFLTRVHLDGLWTTASTHGRIYGLVGSHLSLVDVGRLQIFGPPGVILLSVPDFDGSRQITLGYTWGVSVRLADTRLFGQRDMTLFLNVSKVWVNGGDRGNSMNFGGFEAIGFSLAPRKKR